MKIPYVAQYKYLGITFDYTMRFGVTLDRVSKQVRNMNNYKVLGSTEMSLSQRFSIWKTYFHSKLLYPLVTLSLKGKYEIRAFFLDEVYSYMTRHI